MFKRLAIAELHTVHLTWHGICGSTCRDCFPKMAPAKREVYCLYKVSTYYVHLESSQCFGLHVMTLIMLPCQCGVFLSLVSGINYQFVFFITLCPVY